MFKLFLKSNLEDYKYLLILSPIINFVLFTILFINIQFIPGDDKGIGIFIIALYIIGLFIFSILFFVFSFRNFTNPFLSKERYFTYTLPFKLSSLLLIKVLSFIIVGLILLTSFILPIRIFNLIDCVNNHYSYTSFFVEYFTSENLLTTLEIINTIITCIFILFNTILCLFISKLPTLNKKPTLTLIITILLTLIIYSFIIHIFSILIVDVLLYNIISILLTSSFILLVILLINKCIKHIELIKR